MGGIIAGFLGGVGEGMAKAGTMMLADKLETEREEANFLRESELRKSMQQAGFTHAELLATDRQGHDERLQSNRQTHLETLQTSKIGADDARSQAEIDAREKEGAAKDRASMSRVREQGLIDKEIANIRADASGDDATTNMKNYDHLISLGLPKDKATSLAHKTLREITDPLTRETVLIDANTEKEVGRLAITASGTEWIPAGKQTANAPVTSKHKNAAKAWAADQATWDNLDATDFAKYPGKTGKDKRANAIAAYAQQLANDERDNKPGLVDTKDAPGIVDQATPEEAVAEPKVNGETKEFGRKGALSRQQYIQMMKKVYPDADDEEIGKQWDAK